MTVTTVLRPGPRRAAQRLPGGGAADGHAAGRQQRRRASATWSGSRAELLPRGFGYEWTELAFQQRATSGSGLLIFPLSVLFVFLVLTAQYESWSLPIAIVLIVPLCLLFAITALMLRGLDVNILSQIGFVVLIGLASKNAILIVEFARQKESAAGSSAMAPPSRPRSCGCGRS